MLDILEENGKFYVIDESGKKLDENGFPTREEAMKFMSVMEKGKVLSDRGQRRPPMAPPGGAPDMAGLMAAMGGGGPGGPRPPMAGPPMGGPPGMPRPPMGPGRGMM